MPSEPQELVFPLRGISEGWSFGRQPEGTCPNAQNVVPIDSIGSRIRGGQRWGLSKYYSTLHNAANALQALASVTQATSGALLSNDFTEAFTYANGYFYDSSPSIWDHYKGNIVAGGTDAIFDSVIDIDGDSPTIDTNVLTAVDPATPAINTTTHLYKGADLTFSSDYSLATTVTLPAPADDGSSGGYLFFLFRVNPEHNDECYIIQLSFISYGSTYFFAAYRNKAVIYANLLKATTAGTSAIIESVTVADYTLAAKTALEAGINFKISITAAGALKITAGELAGSPFDFTETLDSYSSYHQVGFGLDPSESDFTIDNFAIVGSDDTTSPQSNRVFKLIVVSGGDIYTAKTQDQLKRATNGLNALATSGRIDMQSAYGKTYFCDGTAAGYKVLNNTTNTVSAWTPVAGSLPVGTVDATTACRIIALYRGRIVLAGLFEYPHNWYMSKVNAPLNWDYGATTSAVMAVAGNNTDAGECPDIITCLAPHSDDLMYIGGDHTLWVMAGDPAGDGRIDNISEQIGVAGPDAWTFDSSGVFYFFGMGTVWRLVPGGTPEALSRTRLDATLAAINLRTHTVHLHWDNVRNGLFIFVIPSASGAATHYYWDQQSDSFWKIVFPNAMGPSTAYAYDGDNPSDNALLLGGWDGYIRYIDPSVKNDDSTKIESYLLYPPIAGGPERNIRINRISAILDTNSDAVTLMTYAEDTVQRVVESATIRFSQALAGGRNTVFKRVAGNAVMVKLYDNTASKAWAVENIVVNTEVTGRTRKNQI